MIRKPMLKYKVNSLLSWENGKIPPPVILNLRLTQRCNLKCLVCEKSIAQHNNKELSEKKLLEIMDEATKLGIKELNIDGGGELFVRKKTALKIMKKAKSRGMRGTLATNGTLLDEKDIKNIIKMKWDEILVSLDGPNAKIHDHLRGVNGAFKKTLKTLKLFQNYKKNFKINKPKITIATILINQNYNKILHILELISHFGITEFRLQLLQKRTKFAQKFKLNIIQEKEFQTDLKNLKTTALKYNILTNLNFFYNPDVIQKSFRMGGIMKKEVKHHKEGLLSVHCHLPWLYIGVREDGYVEPCFGSCFQLENIENETLKEIWTSNFFTNIRRSIKEKKFYSCCKTCCGSQVMDTKELNEEIKRIQDEKF